MLGCDKVIVNVEVSTVFLSVFPAALYEKRAEGNII